jgi:hypothetical protein
MAEGKTREIKISIPEEFFTLFLPEATHEHMLRAKREILLALRSVIDMKIEALDKKTDKKAVRKKKIEIE